MRIGELSRQSGLAVPTIKYYLREGLLPQGELSSPNQAHYDAAHVRRLRLIRALVDVGGLSIAAVRALLAEMDAPEPNVDYLMGMAQYSVTAPSGGVRDAAWESAHREALDLVGRHGWQVDEESEAFRSVIGVIATFRALGQEDLLPLLDSYAEAVDRLARLEVEAVRRRGELEGIIEGVVVGTVLGDTAIAALRRLAQAMASERTFEG